MYRIRFSQIILIALLLTFIPMVPSTSAAPPSAKDLQALSGKMQAYWEKNQEAGLSQEKMMEGLAQIVKESLGDLDFSDMSAEDIGNLQMFIGVSPDLQTLAADRLSTLASEKTVEGAAAAITRIGMMQDDPTEATKLALRHPKLIEAIKSGQGGELFWMVGMLEEKDLTPLAEELLALGDIISPDLSPEVLMGMSEYPSILAKLGDRVPAAKVETIRIKLYDTMLAAAKKSEDSDFAERMESVARFLNGAAARGQLINHTAPALAFTWSNGPDDFKTLKDLQGKVVILDFWATWCGPCVASFPEVRKLQKHYEGYDVAIIGVTSLQGKHYPGDGPPVDTEDDPDKEYSLMKQFMGKKDMTWNVAFSKEEVFNPDYGVRGIPHLAIISPEGKVIHNGLHPSSPLEEKTEKIDALLKKAGLPAPVPPPAAQEDADEKD